MSVLNNPKGKPVLLTLQYTIRIILNHIKYSRNHIQNSTLQRKSNNQNILHYRSNNMTPYLTSDNDAKLKHGSDYIQNHNVTLNCDTAYLKYYNTKVDWSLRNNRLFCNIFASHKPITCNLCHSTDHTAGFCPELLLEKNQRSHKDNSHNAFSQNQTIDIYGRPKRFFQGKEICNNFNGERGCVRPACNRAHVCFTCNKEHSQLSCSQDRARSNKSKNFQSPRNQPQKS